MSHKTKVCPACGNEFEPYHGNQKYCLECAAEANLESVRKAARRYYRANRERLLEYKRGYYRANRERILEQQREYRKANREKLAEYQRKYNKANREKVNERQREYRRKHKKNGGKPLKCKFNGSCLECPYPDCVES